MPAFSEESIQRQLGYMAPAPQPAGYLYTHAHPVTGEEVEVWYDARYVEDYSYGRKHENGCERFYHQGDCIVHHECFSAEGTASPPRYRYVEGYHDPILKGLAPDWWRLFGHDVPKQFILSPTSVEGPDSNFESKKAEEKDAEWDAAAYFGPYRAADTEACRGSEGAHGEAEAEKIDGREDGDNCTNGGTTRAPIEGRQRECRGRDDWECDFCGPECFCWTVKGEKGPADDIQSPMMRLYKETCSRVGTTTGRS